MDPVNTLLCFGDPDQAARIARYGLPASLFLIGLAGSLIHCLGMCGPFVLGQVAARSEGSRSYGELQRLSQGALLPYHLGRMTTYAALGAVAGVLGAGIFASPAIRWAAALLTLLAALGLAAQLFPKLAIFLPSYRFMAPLTDWVTRRAAGMVGRGNFGLWRFGVMLGFLPCGFLWGALAIAAASGSAARGLSAMAAFALGTMPALVGLGWGGAMLASRTPVWVRRLALPLQGLNVVFLLWISARTINGF
jgi:sulfite exporter TauE/SafE